MIYTQPIACPNVERVSYIIYGKSNKCVGTFVEQENDAGEVQYLFKINQSILTKEDLDDILVPGIDLTTRETVYVRSYNMPYFLERCSPRRDRGDTPENLQLMQMDFLDPFEYMLRSRAITHHSNCYVGRFPTDFIDFERARKDDSYYGSIIPNLNEQPDNVFHKIEEV